LRHLLLPASLGLALPLLAVPGRITNASEAPRYLLLDPVGQHGAKGSNPNYFVTFPVGDPLERMRHGENGWEVILGPKEELSVQFEAESRAQSLDFLLTDSSGVEVRLTLEGFPACQGQDGSTWIKYFIKDQASKKALDAFDRIGCDLDGGLTIYDHPVPTTRDGEKAAKGTDGQAWAVEFKAAPMGLGAGIARPGSAFEGAE
jgi:hypothetical protein